MNSVVSRHSRRETIWVTSLGTSIPMAALPGMGASTRTSIAASDMARLSASETIFLTKIPGSNWTS